MGIKQNGRIDSQQRWKHQGSKSSTTNKKYRPLNLLCPLECEHEHRQM